MHGALKVRLARLVLGLVLVLGLSLSSLLA